MCPGSAVHHLGSPSGSTGRAKCYSRLKQRSVAKVTEEKSKDDSVKSDQNSEIKPDGGIRTIAYKHKCLHLLNRTNGLRLENNISSLSKAALADNEMLRL